MKNHEGFNKNNTNATNEKLDQVQPNEASETAMFGVGRAWQQHNQARRYEEIRANNEFLRGTYAAERDIILKEPEFIGSGMDRIIVNGAISYKDEYLQTGDNSLLPEKLREYDDATISRLINEQDDLVEKFKQYIDSFNGQLRRVRINRTPSSSPLNLSNVIRPDGSAKIASEFIEQVKYLQESGVNDITMVAGAFYDRNGEATDGYLIGQDREDYFNMIDSLVEQVGQNVTIELTNETNEDIMVDGNILVAKYVEPAKYAEFYKDVASRLKQKYPDLRLAIAGTAASDPKYIREVLGYIGDPNLVDVISTHPYRASIDGPSAVDDDSKTTSYLDEEDELISLAKEYGASYQIGAVTYADEADHDAYSKLSQDLTRAAAKGVKSNIWPRDGLVF